MSKIESKYSHYMEHPALQPKKSKKKEPRSIFDSNKVKAIVFFGCVGFFPALAFAVSIFSLIQLLYGSGLLLFFIAGLITRPLFSKNAKI